MPHEPWIDRRLRALTLFAHRRPFRVLFASTVLLALSWSFAARLEVRADFLELLPTESEAARLLRATLGRMGGGSASLTVIVESPDPEANRRIVDALEPGLQRIPRSMVRTVEHGPEETRRFYRARRWLFADVGDLEEIECELARERRNSQPGYIDLDDETCRELRSDHGQPSEAPTVLGVGNVVSEAPEPAGTTAMGRFKRRMNLRLRDADRFPTGYFRNDRGSLYALVMRAVGTGTGDASGDALLSRVQRVVSDVHPERFHPRARVGFGGDVPSAIAEREALVRDVALASGAAITLILGGIALFFRSFGSLATIGFAMITGVGVAFATAMGAFGYLNASTAFLGSIIAGNGINYAILYLARYRERRGAGDPMEAALLDAALTTRVGTQLAAFAAAGAYGSLMLTTFRGFSQFGLIGAVGMIACWCATFVTVPASVTAIDRVHRALESKLGRERTDAAPREVSAPLASLVGSVTQGYAAPILVFAAALSIAAAIKLPRYLKDPWEYNFAKLGSKGSRQSGADRWNSKADQIFTARGGSPDLLLADSMDQVLPLVAALRARDRAITGGRFIDRVETVYDRLGGTPEVVQRKIELLNQLRTHIDALMPYLSLEDQETAREWRPPEGLAALRPEELPALVREQFTERSGRFGTPFFVYYKPSFTPSDGRQLMVVAELTENLRLPSGRVVPTVSRSVVFAEMVASMGRDGPRATLAAFLSVVFIVVLATRRLRAIAAVLGSLLCAVLLTVGGAAWLDVRLNFLNFVALPLTFGIGVEYAMNLQDRIQHTHGEVSAAVRSVGGAVALCSFTTIVGYAALLTGDSQALASFGWYAIAGEFACVTTALFFLPSVLKVWRR